MHALKEIRRALIPGGLLIDLRPVASHWPVEVMAGAETFAAGQVQDLPAQIADDAASEAALAQAESAGWFIRESAGAFDLAYYWDTPDEMKTYVDEDWRDYIGLPDDVLAQARRMMAAHGAAARARVRLRMFVSRWRRGT